MDLVILDRAVSRCASNDSIKLDNRATDTVPAISIVFGDNIRLIVCISTPSHSTPTRVSFSPLTTRHLHMGIWKIELKVAYRYRRLACLDRRLPSFIVLVFDVLSEPVSKSRIRE